MGCQEFESEKRGKGKVVPPNVLLMSVHIFCNTVVNKYVAGLSSLWEERADFEEMHTM